MAPGSPVRLAFRIGCAAAAAAALALPPAAALAAWPFGASGPAEPTHEIKAPFYGDALYYFFQDRYFTSITTLMASQQFDRVVKHDDEAEILLIARHVSQFRQLLKPGEHPRCEGVQLIHVRIFEGVL